MDPIPLTKNDISKYSFSAERLIRAIREANSFTGDTYCLNPRLHFIGERIIGDLNTAFILALFPNIQTTEPHLLSLTARITANYKQIVVVTPSLSLTREPIYAKLRTASIFPVKLPTSFSQKDFKIHYLVALRRSLPASVSTHVPSLTDEQLADIDRFGYLCQDRLHIPGTYPRERSNDVSLNGQKLQLGNSLFALLMRFVVELRKKKDGWVNIYTLESDGIITDPLNYQIYSRLRTEIRGSLLDKDGKKFIEASHSKTYRISTHPDFVTYDKKKLLNHHYPDIEKLAGRLP